MRRSWMREVKCCLTAILLAVIAAICVMGSIQSQAADIQKDREAYYEQLEREYIGRVRQFLEEQGYRSSGVTLNRVVDGDGQRSYKVLVHHGALGRLEEEARAEVLGQIEEMGFYVPGCSFTAQLLR